MMQRMVANKVTLAARLDMAGVKDDTHGDEWKSEIQKKVEKWEQPSVCMRTKPLPIPGEGPKKRRGGRRMRKLKESRAMTEIQKRMNRRGFGVAAKDYADEAMGIEYGSLEQGSGDLRGVAVKKIKLCRMEGKDDDVSTENTEADRRGQ